MRESRVDQEASTNLEDRFAGRLLNRVGIVLLIFGAAFFIKFAFDRDWVTPLMQVLLGAGAGALALVSGDVLRRRGYADYAHVLTGGGIVVLYLAIYGAFAFYDLIGQTPAFVLMFGVTNLAVLLAARYDAFVIAALGLIGGFLTPALLSTDQSREVALFGYITLLNGGVLALARKKGWRTLNYMAFAASVVLFLAWSLNHYEESRFPATFLFVSCFYLTFALVPVLQNFAAERLTRLPDASLATTNAMFYFAAGYALLYDRAPRSSGAFALMLAGFNLLLLLFGRGRRPTDKLAHATFGGLTTLFVTLAVAVQLEGRWMTIAWSIEAATLVWIALRAGVPSARYGALAIFSLAGLYWLASELNGLEFLGETGFRPLINPNAFAAYVLAGALSIAAVLSGRAGEDSQIEARERETWRAGFVIGANALLLALITLDTHAYFERAKQFDGADFVRLENAKQTVISVAWALWGAAGLVFGFWRGRRLLRVGALALLGATVLKVFLFDLAALDTGSRIISFVVLGAALLGVSFLYQKRTRAEEPPAS